MRQLYCKLLTAITGLLLINAINCAVSLSSDGKSILVDGTPFFIRGINYSPVPIGEDVNDNPYGDYFTIDYAYQWERDFKLIKATGANTIRIYAWANDVDHTPFLDAVNSAGLKVIITYYVSNKLTPISSDEQYIIDGFASQVSRYSKHPAVLAWIFGNELNGPWNEFLSEFSAKGNCGWTSDACFNKDNTVEPCLSQSRCAYNGLFGWINRALSTAKQLSGNTVPLLSASFADVDAFGASGSTTRDKIGLYGSVLSSMDFVSVQLYRGESFKNYFDLFARSSNKLVLVSEYGIDAYNDPCGWKENDKSSSVCTNIAGDGIGGASRSVSGSYTGCDKQANGDKPCDIPGEDSQASYDATMANELELNSFINGKNVCGGLLMAWHDEYWKGGHSNDVCRANPCTVNLLDPINSIQSCLSSAAYQMGGSAGCTAYSHVSCNNHQVLYHDICGGNDGGSPDSYRNEQWFGINEIQLCSNNKDKTGAHNLAIIKPRKAVYALASIWGGSVASIDSIKSSITCSALESCWSCSVGNGFTEKQIESGICKQYCSILNGVNHFPPDTIPDPNRPRLKNGAPNLFSCNLIWLFVILFISVASIMFV